jgi:diaminopropionate ammonia-lyase
LPNSLCILSPTLPRGDPVVVTDVNYDDTVRLSCRMAEENGWYVIQDTAWEGYTEIPLWIMQGYMTMCVEAVNQMALTGLRPTHVFVQVGVGALAGAVIGYLLNEFSNHAPRFNPALLQHGRCHRS